MPTRPCSFFSSSVRKYSLCTVQALTAGSSRYQPYFYVGYTQPRKHTFGSPHLLLVRNFPAGGKPILRKRLFQANRRLRDVQQLSHDCLIDEDAFRQVTQPQVVAGQRVSALPFADPRTQALLSVLVLYCLLPQGFANKDIRARLALLLGLDPSAMTLGKMTYDLRRLRLHGLIERIPHTHRYRVTDEGLRTALFFTRVYARILRPGLARLAPTAPPGDTALQPYFDKVEGAIERWIDQAKLVA